jgi:hypothetical protein
MLSWVLVGVEAPSGVSDVGMEGGVGMGGVESVLEDIMPPLRDDATGRETIAVPSPPCSETSRTGGEDGAGPSTRRAGSRAGSRMVRRPGEYGKGSTSL